MKVLAFITSLALWVTAPFAAAREVSVVVTVNPLALLLDEVGGDRLSVAVLVPPGASPHGFAPRPSDLVKVARADGFLSVGGGLDDWAQRLLAAAGASTSAKTLLGLVGFDDRAASPHDHGSRSHADPLDPDPHIWLDPIFVQQEIVPELVGWLSEIDPTGAQTYSELGLAFARRLDRLDRDLRDLLGSDARHYVAFHSAWHHFARRYALEEIAVVQEAAGEEPTPRELGNLVREARRAKLGAILIEPQLDPRIAQTLSDEFGGTTVVVDPLGHPHDPERSTYPNLLRFNARAFRVAMDRHAERGATR